MDISKENLAVTFKTPQTLDNPHRPAQSTTTALTCPSHIDSPPEGPNQLFLFSDTLPAWTCSGHQRHSSIRPGWLWLIWPPNDQFVSLSPSPSFFFFSLLFSLLFLTLSPSLHSLAIFLMCRIWWKSVSADRFDTVACESNNAITIWPWTTTNSHVHLSVFLTHVALKPQWKPTTHSCKHTIIFLHMKVLMLKPSWSLTCWDINA